MRKFSKVLITGGAGFIGSNLTRFWVTEYPSCQVFNLDDLTYAGNLENLREIEKSPNYHFLKGSVADRKRVEMVFIEFAPDLVLHLAAESHVDRSIDDPHAFVTTNVLGTVNLLNAALTSWQNSSQPFLFYHISTDEVYGTLGVSGYFTESSKYDPRSPYSASKAAADHFVRAYAHTYGLPVVLSNCSNNYGPFQFPEKLIPLIINNILNEKSLPVYGDGLNVRDWLFVLDHIRAIDRIAHEGRIGETYAVGGRNEWKNIDLVKKICHLMDRKLNHDPGHAARLIKFIKDRPGHDRRYAINTSKIQYELGWSPETDMEEGLEITISWYLENQKWLENVRSGVYMEYYEKMYNI
jgi:dTDP-glucose 4,6-dehydratase